MSFTERESGRSVAPQTTHGSPRGAVSVWTESTNGQLQHFVRPRRSLQGRYEDGPTRSGFEHAARDQSSARRHPEEWPPIRRPLLSIALTPARFRREADGFALQAAASRVSAPPPGSNEAADDRSRRYRQRRS